MDNKYTVGIITASDKGSKGEREDISGRRIREILPAENYEVVSYKVLPDEQEELEQEMIHLADECKCNLILTTGGTGFSMRDVTPEATLAVCDRNAPGIAEAIRAYSMTITTRHVKPWCECDPWTVTDRKSAGQSEGGGGEPDLYLRFVGTWDGYPVRERWGVCTEMITLFMLEST